MNAQTLYTGPIPKADRRDLGSRFVRIVCYCQHGERTASYHFIARTEVALDAVAAVAKRKNARYVGALLGDARVAVDIAETGSIQRVSVT